LAAASFNGRKYVAAAAGVNRSIGPVTRDCSGKSVVVAREA
jgi:hypothetical protein